MMGANALEALTARLDQLEGMNATLRRECRRWRRGVGAMLLLGLGLTGLAGAAAANIYSSLESEQFMLRDSQGRLRAALTIRPDGTPGLGLFDEQGKVRLSLDLASDGGPGINIYDKASTLRAALAIRPDGTPALGLFDAQGRCCTSLETEPTDKAPVERR